MILKFKEWELIQEALDPTKHFEERVQERIINLKEVLLPQQLLASLPNTISAAKLKEQVKDLFIKEALKRIERLKKSSLASDKNSAYPLIAPYLYHDGKKYPVVIDAEFKDKSGRIKSMIGTQFYVPIRNGSLMTVLIYPSEAGEMEIERSQENHLERNFGKSQSPLVMVNKGHDYEYNLEVENGKVIKKKEGKHVPIDYSRDQQYNLARGNKIKVFVKFANDFVEGEIANINNRLDDAFRDGGVGLDLLIDVNGKKMKLPKKLPVGEMIQLPIGPDGEWVKAQVSSPGYIIDARMDEPINLKFRAKQ